MLGVQSGWGREGKWSLGPLTDDIDDGVVAPVLRCAHLTLKDAWRKWEWRYCMGTTSSTGGMGTGESGTELYTTALELMSCVCQRMKLPGCS